MADYIVSGFHSLKFRNKELYKTVVVLQAVDSKGFVSRHTLFIDDDRPFQSIREAHSEVRCIPEDEVGMVEEDLDTDVGDGLQGFKPNLPYADDVVNTVEGVVVGWHVRLRTNITHGGTPSVMGVIAILNEYGALRYIDRQQRYFKPTCVDDFAKEIQVEYAKVLGAFPLGGKVTATVQKGRNRGWLKLEDFREPKATLFGKEVSL